MKRASSFYQIGYQKSRRPKNGDEQSDARERRSRVDLQWTIFRRQPVISDVSRQEPYP